jgi:hypothetical protein
VPESIQLLDLKVLSDDQFRIRPGEETHYGSLYYLGIDLRSVDHGCPAEHGLHRASDWLTQLTNSDDRSQCYLPFDFADESMQWIACEARGDFIEIVFGWLLSKAGQSLHPTSASMPNVCLISGLTIRHWRSRFICRDC